MEGKEKRAEQSRKKMRNERGMRAKERRGDRIA